MSQPTVVRSRAAVVERFQRLIRIPETTPAPREFGLMSLKSSTRKNTKNHEESRS
jgi:hypothetical protein